ncbi:protein of unknown function [Aminobacter niigataensis]|nr:protein of unknown function [Aminobacter niigataensis]
MPAFIDDSPVTEFDGPAPVVSATRGRPVALSADAHMQAPPVFPDPDTAAGDFRRDAARLCR